MNPNDFKRVLEALIFAADAPLTPERIRETMEASTDEELAQTVETLNGEYEAAGHSFMIRQVAGGYQVTTRPEYSNWIKKLYLGRQKGRLSQAGLESLAIIAFKQPISRVDIAQIRGVNSDAVIGTLLERKLVTISGRSDAIGRPLLYSTTPEFLEFFGINDLAELPKPREIEELIGKEGMPEEVLQALSSDKQLKLPISFEPETLAEGIAPNVPLLLPRTSEHTELVDAVVVEDDAVEVIAPQTESASEEAPPTDEASAHDEIGATINEAAAPVTIISEAEVESFIPLEEQPAEVPAPIVAAEVVVPTKKSKDRKRGKRSEPTSEVVEESSASETLQNTSETIAETDSAHVVAEEAAEPVIADNTIVEITANEEASANDSPVPKQEAPTQDDLAAETSADAIDALVLAESDLDSQEEQVHESIAAVAEDLSMTRSAPPEEADNEDAIVENYPLAQVTIVAADEATRTFELVEPSSFDLPTVTDAPAVIPNVNVAPADEVINSEPELMLAAAPVLAEPSLLLAEEKAEEESSGIDIWPEVHEVRFEQSRSSVPSEVALRFAPHADEVETAMAEESSSTSIHIVDEVLALPAVAPVVVREPETEDAPNVAPIAEPDFFV